MKIKLFLLVILLAIGGSLHAQTFSGQAGSDIFIPGPFRFCFGVDNGQQVCITQTAANTAQLSNGYFDFVLTPKIVSTLPPFATNKGRMYLVGDGTSTSDCSVGGGATINICYSNGLQWLVIGSGGGGGGGVPSVFGRIGSILAQTGDYTCQQVTNCGSYFPTDVLPITTGSQSLGNSSQRWLNGYIQNLHVSSSIIFDTVAPIIWTSVEGSCTGATSGSDVLCIGDLTTHQILESDNGGTFFPLAKGTGSFTPGHLVGVSSTNPLLLNDAGSAVPAVSSVFGRTGAVTAQSGDYTCVQVSGCGSGSGFPLAGPGLFYDVQNGSYGAIAYPFGTATESTTATCTGGTNHCTLAAAQHFVNNEGIVIYQGGSATTQSTPSAPSVAVPSVTGSTTFHYQCAGLDALGGLSAASTSGTTTTAPTIFGAPQVVISSISLTSNVVTVNATGIGAVTGQYVSISGVTGSGSTWNGFWKVATGGTNSFTYALTSANGTGTVGASSFAQLTNTRGVTALSRSTSGVITVTTDGNHNFTTSGTNQPTLAIINGASPLDFNGTYAVLTASTNTMTLQSAISPANTETGSVTTGFTTVTVYEQVIVTCPALSGSTINYAVYGDSPNGGSTITYLGETMYGQKTFVDWGPFLAGNPQKRGYVPTLPPGAAQNQLFVGKILSGGTTTSITLTTNITSSVTSQTMVHDESQGIQAALNAASGNNGGTVYLSPIASGSCEYVINYPVSIPTSVNLLLGAGVISNEPVKRQGANRISADVSGCNATSPQFSNRTYMQWSGTAKELLHGASGDTSSTVDGILFTTSVNGQNLLVFDGQTGGYDNVFRSFFNAPNSATTAIGITYIGGPSGISSHHIQDVGSLLFGPLGQGGPAGTQTGLMPFTPPQIPGIWFRGSDAGGSQFVGGSQVTIDGKNTLNGRGVLYDETFCSNCTGQKFEMSNNWNQGPTTPMLMFYGNDGGTTFEDITLRRIQQDSSQIACFGDWARLNGPTVIDNCTTSGGAIGLVTGNVTPQLTVYGLIPNSIVGQNTSFISFPAQGSAFLINASNITLDSSGNITNGSIAIPPVIPVNFTTAGATTSDVLTVTGMTASGHCWVSPSNSSAATGFVVGTTWLDTPATNAITLHHTNTNGQIFTVACTPN